MSFIDELIEKENEEEINWKHIANVYFQMPQMQR